MEFDGIPAHLQESIRKLKELEKDKPVWEEEKQKRRRREAQEEAERIVREQARQRERKQKEQVPHRARSRDLLEDENRKSVIDARMREHLRQLRERKEGKSVNPESSWTSSAAFDRFHHLCKTFDDPAVGKELPPPTFNNIPWPVLFSPVNMDASDITWEEVERFFHAYRLSTSDAECKKMIDDTMKRFHTDQLRKRRLFDKITDEMERHLLEHCATIVAQAAVDLRTQRR